MILFFFTSLIPKSFSLGIFLRGVVRTQTTAVSGKHLVLPFMDIIYLHFCIISEAHTLSKDFGKQCLFLHRPYQQWHIKEIAKQKRKKTSVSLEQNKILQFFIFYAWKAVWYVLLAHLFWNWLYVVRHSLERGYSAWQRGRTAPPLQRGQWRTMIHSKALNDLK